MSPGTLFCPECGLFQLNAASRPTDTTRSGETPAFQFDGGWVDEERPFTDEGDSGPPPPLLGQDMESTVDVEQITFFIPVSRRRLTLALRDEIQVGRADPAGGYYPELDLTGDGGADRGVSRRHAVIERSNRGITLIDRHSTNGTALNNFRVPPDLPYPLRNGDEIRFGRLLVHVFLD